MFVKLCLLRIERVRCVCHSFSNTCKVIGGVNSTYSPVDYDTQCTNHPVLYNQTSDKEGKNKASSGWCYRQTSGEQAPFCILAWLLLNNCLNFFILATHAKGVLISASIFLIDRDTGNSLQLMNIDVEIIIITPHNQWNDCCGILWLC